MSEAAAVSFKKVTKVYRLYRSPVEQAIDVLGFGWMFRRGRRGAITEFPALRDVDLEVTHGERVGVIGRNGAGKTTLLKLITGNFGPSSGEVSVDGTVQALMTVGLGFHPEFSGYDNIQSALLYNGLTKAALAQAADEVIEFAELGDFLHRPLKTYSLGMQARLMFATATAVRPDILVVDEVLGAGDAYFAAKCAHRMERLTRSGCTLLLVSHSMEQVLQFCQRAIWLESGSIVLDGDALHVVKAYEEFAQKLERARADYESEPKNGRSRTDAPTILDNQWLREKLLAEILQGSAPSTVGPPDAISSGGISRWAGGEGGLRIERIAIVDDAGEPLSVVKTGSPLSIALDVTADEAGDYPLYAVILLFAQDGRWLTRHCSEEYRLKMEQGQRWKLRLRYDRVLLGNGTYCFSAAIYKTLDPHDVRRARFYDLLSRSFEFKVVGPYRDDQSIFYHPATWGDAGPEGGPW